ALRRQENQPSPCQHCRESCLLPENPSRFPRHLFLPFFLLLLLFCRRFPLFLFLWRCLCVCFLCLLFLLPYFQHLLLSCLFCLSIGLNRRSCLRLRYVIRKFFRPVFISCQIPYIYLYSLPLCLCVQLPFQNALPGLKLFSSICRRFLSVKIYF